MAKTTIQKLKLKKEMIELLQVIISVLDQKEEDTKKDYLPVGELDEQDTHWRTGELLWEDEEKTIPKKKKKYDYIEKPELDENDLAKIEAINQIRVAIEKLV